MKTATRTISLGLVVVIAVVLGTTLTGCGSRWQNYAETRIDTSEDGLFSRKAPEWVKGLNVKEPGDDADRIYFVGRGIGYNTFDERAAYDSARDHVLQQLGKQIATWVSVRVTEVDKRGFCGGEKPLGVALPFLRRNKGPRFLPGEMAKQKLVERVRLTTLALAGDLVDEGVYWEKWVITELPRDRTLLSNTPTRTMKRYKCWVRMSISKTELESRINATLKALAISASKSCPGKTFGVTGGHSGGDSGEKPRLCAEGARYLFQNGL